MGTFQKDCKSESGFVPTIAVLSMSAGDMFHHFLAEVLPRVEYVRREVPESFSDPATRFHVNCFPRDGRLDSEALGRRPAYVPDFFTLLGIPIEGYGKSRLLTGCW